jgi:hypothetical protein
VTQKNAQDDDPKPDQIYEAGTIASVLQLLKLPDGTVKVLVEGLHRATISQYLQTEDYFEAEANILEEPEGDPVEIEALPGKFRFHEVDHGVFDLDGAKVTVAPVPHIGPTVGYRIDCEGVSVAYVSDHQQPGVGATEVAGTVLDLCQGVDLLIEIGPQPHLCALAQPRLAGRPALPSLRRGQDGCLTMAESVAALHCAGARLTPPTTASNILPGFIVFFGSNIFLIPFMNSISLVLRENDKSLFFSNPIPCSALILPS